MVDNPVTTSSMFPAPTIYNQEAPPPPNPRTQIPSILGLADGEIAVVIVEKSRQGGMIIAETKLLDGEINKLAFATKTTRERFIAERQQRK